MESAGIINDFWRSITGFVNYQVSNIGRVRDTATGAILRPFNDGRYCKIVLYNDEAMKIRYIHRLGAQEFIDNLENKPYVDHIDKCKTNNCASNLRWVYPSENNMNARKTSNSKSSRFKGVRWCKQKKKWLSKLRKDNHVYHLGYFHEEKEAARAYNEKAMELFGEYAHINYISDDDDDDDDDEGTVLSGDPLNTHYL